MTDQKPTGVFVRLPLSSDDIRRMGRAMSQNLEAHAKPTLESASEAALLAIGTPVRTDGLRTFLRAIVSGKSLVGMLEPDSKRKILDVFEDIPLVRQSDAQAQIATRDAEIARLQEDLGKETGAYLRLLSRRSVAEIIAENKEVARLREALVTARDAITSDLNAKSIVCTVWAGPAETLVDYIDAALKGGAA